MANPSITITGIGTINPLGACYADTAAGFLKGQSGVRAITRFDTTHLPTKFAGTIGEIPVPIGEDPRQFASLERMNQLLHWCTNSALLDAGLWDLRSSLRLGIVVGNGGEWLRLWEADRLAGGTRVHDPSQDAESSVEMVKRRLGIQGPATTIAAACASGNYAIAEARRWLQLGWVDICLAGATDLTVSPLGVAAFGNLRALSTRNDSPTEASRPFDRTRDGFVMAEGGAMFVLETADHARRRSARRYADVVGFGASSDAYHLVIPSKEPKPAANAMLAALQDASLAPDRIDYINAHATSTPVGDSGEARAIALAFGDSARRIPTSSTKSITGHLLCAAAAVELIACIGALEHQAVPPTINLHDLDPECAGICHVPGEAQPRRVVTAISNSFGFGGSNTSLIIRKPE